MILKEKTVSHFFKYINTRFFFDEIMSKARFSPICMMIVEFRGTEMSSVL